MSRETAEQLRSGVARGLNQSCWEDGFREGRAEGAEIVESLITPTFNRATWLRDRGCYAKLVLYSNDCGVPGPGWRA